MDQISKIVNVHLIDLKFEEELHITSLNSTTNFFLLLLCTVKACMRVNTHNVQQWEQEIRGVGEGRKKCGIVT